ncbi:hypothetical protein EG329_004281 [Mollisiaceae sp. DMI_Dod_QoI]|nr:hypothetical protein EG329_004281 [Helotiales sp. DMI_Dod_QoI]
MDVIIRSVPEQSGNNQLREFLRPYFERLSISSRSVNYRNTYNFNRAFLTFLRVDDGERFLLHHGQKQRPQRNVTSTPIDSRLYKQLRFLGRNIYCEKDSHDPSPIALRVLEQEEKEVLAGKDPRKPRDQDVLPMTLKASSISCGILTFKESELVFVPYNVIQVPGEVQFGRRSIIITLESNLRIDFIYSAIESTTIEIEPNPSFLISMVESPRFFEKIIDPIKILAAMLSSSRISVPRSRDKGPERHRLAYLSPDHKPIASHCLIWKIDILRTKTIGQNGMYEDTSTKMQKLERSHETPRMVQRHIRTLRPSQPYAVAFEKLNSALSSLNCPFPFALAFQVQKLAENNYLPPSTVLGLLGPITEMLERSGLATSILAIRRLFNQVVFPGPNVDSHEFEITTLARLLRENEEQVAKYSSAGLSVYDKASRNVAVIHRVKVTPVGTYLYGPEAESNNRILRKYPKNHDSFLRVQFCEEDGGHFYFNQKISYERILHGRFKHILEHGITIAGRTFTFLGFSHSSLRMHNCWFVAPFVQDGALILDRDIIQGLGNFLPLQSPAKCAARIGQAFSDTRTAVPVDPAIVKTIGDAKSNNRVFSDGVGTISLPLLEKIGKELPRARRTLPTCLQIRYKGAKGMVSLDSRLQEDVLCLRPSMIKFEGSNSNDLEICDASYKALPAFLNRQLIKIMEDLGVDDSFFVDLQNDEVNRLRLITESPINAGTYLRKQSIGVNFEFPSFISHLNMLGLDFKADGFIRDVLEVAVLSDLRKLKHATRIPVPKGVHLHGVMDETGLLQEGEVFCIIEADGVRSVISGDKLVVTRSPALHPGDIQLAKGIVPPTESPLMKLSNCICFSQKGMRDLPSQLSGGDLDGDRYYVFWDERAIPKQTFEPAEYEPKTTIDIQRAVQTRDITDFFIEYIEADQLGRIAVGHRVLADQEELGTLSPKCITLAELHSDAVDYTKTGIAPDLTLIPFYGPWRPDFEAPGPHVEIEKREGISFCTDPSVTNPPNGDEDDDFPSYRYYESDRIIGKLYRAIDEREIFEEIQKRSMKVGTNSISTTIGTVWEHVQGACELIQWKHLMDEARGIREMYEDCIFNIMKDFSNHPHRPLSELEVFAGSILGRDGAPNRQQRDLSISMKEKFDEDTLAIVNCIIRDGDEWSSQSLEMSMACLAAGLEDDPQRQRVGNCGEYLLSFKYVAAAVCLREVQRLAVPMLNGVQLLEG